MNQFLRPFIRPATLEDALKINNLYKKTYSPNGGSNSPIFYPFPQLMDQSRVTKMIESGEIAWVVAEGPDGQIVGSAAAVRNIGREDDRIAEIFGIVVDETTQRRSIGSTMLVSLIEHLNDSTRYFLCEARTATPGGWKVARNAGFQPVGFEPYAHAMPVGFESMILTARKGRYWDRVRGSDDVDFISGVPETVLHLAKTVRLHGFCTSESEALSLGNIQLPFPNETKIRQDDSSEPSSFAPLTGLVDCQSGVVMLRPLLGMDERGQRFKEDHLVISAGSRILGSAHYSYDRIDSKVRILSLSFAVGSDRRIVLSGLVDHLDGLASGEPLIIIIWALVHASCLHMELESLGFVATGYLPGMVAGIQGPRDVVQYSMFFRRSLCDSSIEVKALDWHEATAIIRQVIRNDEASAAFNQCSPKKLISE